MDWFKVLGPIGSWCLVILGWKIVRGDNCRRERRKELKDIIDTVISQLDELEGLAHDYLTQGPSTTLDRVGLLIKSKLRLIANDLTVLGKEERTLAFGSDLRELRMIITGGDFDGKNRVARPSNAPIFVEIANTVTDIQNRLKTGFLLIKR